METKTKKNHTNKTHPNHLMETSRWSFALRQLNRKGDEKKMKKIRRNRINSTKIGVIFIISALALAGIGAGYAAWTDTIYIDGNVSTGSVEWKVIDYSGTYVWKVFGAADTGNGPETVVTGNPDYSVLPEEGFRVSYAEATPGTEEFDVNVVFDNLFPCIWFKVDIVIEYTGTVPGRINDILYSYTPENDWLEPLIISGDIYATAKDASGNVVEIGYQLHENDLVFIELWIHIPQDNDLMLKSGAFTATFIVVQWNEYPYEGGECGEDDPVISHGADVVLAIDTSASVGADGPVVITAAQAFVTALLSPNDAQVALVSWDSDAYLESTFSIDIPALNVIIGGLVFNGPATNLGAAITMSQDQLDNYDRTDVDHPDYMVITTDGQWNIGSDPMPIATAAKAAGTTIFVLGVGPGVNPIYLTDIASLGCYYDVANWNDLEAVLLGLI